MALAKVVTFERSTPPEAPHEIVVQADPDDERVWVPQADRVWFRPLMLNTLQGSWTNLLKVKKAGVFARHRHPAPVHGYVIKGSWRYLEHDWVARPGNYVFEPPGETHTLTVDADCEEMITFFVIQGPLIYIDEKGAIIQYEDVFTKIEMCRQHYVKCGLGKSFVDQFVR
ncbi:MAG: 2,4'-dihydroxyacetophenone dioxygenase family protein [Alphaproteobacteria bacterium]|nr:2,4'-dihydroxyacetophenone dioxygenase family protein [Alphaproteobacteria bacterium]